MPGAGRGAGHGVCAGPVARTIRLQPMPWLCSSAVDSCPIEAPQPYFTLILLLPFAAARLEMSKPRVKFESVTERHRSLDHPQPKKQRSGKQGQKPPSSDTRRLRGEEADEDEGEAASSAGGAASNFLPWDVRMERQAGAWNDRFATDVDALLASLPQQVAHQNTWRQAMLKDRQDQLDSAEPLPCPGAKQKGGCCQFSRIGQQEVTFFGLGGVVGQLVQPVYQCSVHGSSSVTAHPLQFSCVPTAPVYNTKLLDVELVEEYRLLQLKDGVGGHGERDVAAC